VLSSYRQDSGDDLDTVHVLWMNGGLSCDGESVSLTAATQPSIEEILLGALPGLPPVAMHWPLLDAACGPDGGPDSFIDWWHRADRGELDPFLLVVEGSVPDDATAPEGYWAGFGNDPRTGQPITPAAWLDRLAPKATGILAVGTCAAYGGVPAMAGNPTGAMGVPDYLGWDWTSKTGLPIVCIPGCPTHPDNLSETLLYLLHHVAGRAPMIPLDEALRPRWLFSTTVHNSCDRAAYYDQSEFATDHGSSHCLVKAGCWGQVVQCNVAKRGWINGVGGCPNVGGICIGCTMPGFPDKFMPFLDNLSPGVATADAGYGGLVHTLRGFTMRKAGQPAGTDAAVGFASDREEGARARPDSAFLEVP
jgi:hydrogenase small subunit